MRQIPLSQIPAQTFHVVLADQYCTLSLYWRQERLYLDLQAGAAVVCRGAVCQNRADIVQSRSQDFAGTLHFFDREGDRPPRWEGLHTGSGGAASAAGRWVLVYVEDGEELPLKLRY
jgi:hypothetical protein